MKNFLNKTIMVNRIIHTTIFICIFFLIMSIPVFAQTTHTVINLNDSGAGSLRDTINSASSGDKIVFNSGLSGTITLTSQLYIDKALTIEGPDDISITLDGNNQTRIFKIYGQYDTLIKISNLTLKNGKTVGQDGENGSNGRTGGGGGGGGAASGGAGILILGGDVTVDNVIFDNNSAVGGNGGIGGKGWDTSLNGDFNTRGGSGGTSELHITPYTPIGAPDFDLDGNNSLRYSGAGGGAGGLLDGTGGNGGDGKGRGGAGGWGGNNHQDGLYYATVSGQGGQGGSGGSAMGGALCLTAGSLELKHSTFTNNTVTAGNGGNGGDSGYWIPSENNPNTPLPDYAKSYFGGRSGDSGYTYGPAVYIGGDIESGDFDVRYVAISSCTFQNNTANTGSVGVGGTDENGVSHIWSQSFIGDVKAVYDNDVFSHYNYNTSNPPPSDYLGYGYNLSDKADYIYITGVTPQIDYSSSYEIPYPNSYYCDVHNNTGNYINADGQQTVTITVTLRSGPNAPVVGVPVVLDQGGGSSTISPANAVTGRDGTAVFTITNTKAETVVYTPKYGISNTPLDTETIEYLAGESDPDGSTITASRATVNANGVDSSLITVTICDPQGNPIFVNSDEGPMPAGKTVALTANNGSSTIETVNSVIDENGRATFLVKNNVAETVTYTATNLTDNYTLTHTIFVQFEAYSWVVNSLLDNDLTGSLRHAITNAPSGETIIFSNSLDGGTLILTSDLPTIDKDLTISGSGVDITIDGNNAHRIFTINSGEVNISNLKLINGKAIGAEGENGITAEYNGGAGEVGQGGAIFANNAELTVTSVDFSNNLAVGGTGGVGGTYSDGGRYSSGSGGASYGGAVSISSGTLNISSSTFTNSSAIGGSGADGGGSSYNNGGNGGHGGASYGGAIYIGGSVTSNITNCTFSSSSTTNGNAGSGGSGSSGTYSGHGGNGGSSYGGAIYVNSSGTLILSDSTFTDSIAVAGNGANAGSGNFNQANSYGGNGGSAYGGAVSTNNATLNINNCSFTGGNVINGTFGIGDYANGTVGVNISKDIYNGSSNINVTNTTFTQGTNIFNNNVASSAGMSTIEASQTNIASDGIATSTITVTLKTANGGTVGSDKTVTLLSDSNNVEITPLVALTNGEGKATFNVSSNYAGTVGFSAKDTTADVTISDTLIINFTYSSSNVSITTNTQNVLANNSNTAMVTVVLTSVDNLPVANKTISLRQGSGSSIITPNTATTDQTGTAVFTVKNNVAETVTYQAYNNTDSITLNGSVDVAFIGAQWMVSSLADTNDFGTLRYSVSNAPNGTPITFDSTLDGTIILTSELPVIDKDLIIDGIGANITISGDNLYRIFTVDSGNVSFKNLSLINGKAIGNSGENWVTTGDYLDGGGTNPAEGGEAGKGGAILINDGNVVVNNIIFSNHTVVGGNGGNCVDVGNTLIAASGGKGGNAHGAAIYISTGNLTVTSSSFSNSTIIGGNGGSGGNGGMAGNGGNGGNTYGAAIYNDNGTLHLSDTSFSNCVFTVGNRGNAGIKLNQYTPSPTNGSNGSYISSFVYNNTGNTQLNTVTTSDSINIYYNSLPISSSASTITSDKTSVSSDGIDYAVITVALKDENGNFIGDGNSVTINAQSGSSTITEINATTNNDGIAAFRVSNQLGQTVTYTATVSSSNTTLDNSIDISFKEVDSNLSVVASSQETIYAGSTNVTVTLRYSNGEAAKNKTVSLSTPNTNTTIFHSSVITDENGQAIFTVSNIHSETVIFTATNVTDNVVLNQTATVEFASVDLNLSTIATDLNENGTETSVTVTLKYSNSNPAQGKTVTLTSSSENTTISHESLITNENGQAIFTVMNIHSETVTFTANNVTDNVTLNQTAAVEFPSIDMDLSTVEANFNGNETEATVVVTLKYSNLIPAAGKTVTINCTGNNTIISHVSQVTDENGIAAFTITNASSETVTITAENITDNVALTDTTDVVFEGHEIIVNSLDDTDTYGTLRYALNHYSSGATIKFSENLDGIITLAQTLPEISENVTIDGAGANISISGNEQYRVFKVNNGNVNIKNIDIINGKKAGSNGANVSGYRVYGPNGEMAYGGGILIENGAVTLENISFNDNIAIGGRGGTSGHDALGGHGGDAKGGAVYIDEGSLIVKNCIFSNNKSIGGLAGLAGTWSYRGANGGHAGDAMGGAIYCENAGITFENNSFSNNEASASDGANAGFGIAGHYNYTFSYNGGNGGNGYGGAIYFNTGSLSITNDIFEDNSVTAGDKGTTINGSEGIAGITLGDDVYSVDENISITNSVFDYYGEQTPIDISLSTVSASQTSLLSNGEDVSTITVTLKYSNGSFGNNKNVTLLCDNSNTQISPISVITNENGVASFEVRAMQAGTYTYTAKVIEDDSVISQSASINVEEYVWVIYSLSDENVLGTLRFALNNVPENETISFQNNLNGTITLSSTLPVIDRSMTIDATNCDVTIDGNNAYRIFEISSGDVSISNLSLINGVHIGENGANVPYGQNGGHGQNAKGGAILINEGNVSLTNVSFNNNSLVGGNGGIAPGSYKDSGNGGNAFGGAIYIENGAINVNNCNFNNSNITGGNGANGGGQGATASGGHGGSSSGSDIYLNDGELIISNTTFNSSTAIAGNGGNGTANVNVGVQGGNAGSARGASIYINSGILDISDCHFSGGSMQAGNYGTGILNNYNYYRNFTSHYFPYPDGSPNGAEGLAYGINIYNQSGELNTNNLVFDHDNNEYYNNLIPDINNSIVTVGEITIAEDGTQSCELSVSLNDEYGNPVSNKLLALVPYQDSYLVLPSTLQYTNSEGKVVYTVTNTVCERVLYKLHDYTENIAIKENIPVDYCTTVSYSSDENGSITGNTNQIINYMGTATQVRAVANSGYRFVKWSDDLVANPRIDTDITENISVTAIFEIIPATTQPSSGERSTPSPEVEITLTDNNYQIEVSTKVVVKTEDDKQSVNVPTEAVTVLVKEAKKAENKGEKAVIEIKLDTFKSVDEIEVILPRSSFNSIANDTDASVKIDHQMISVEFDNQAVETINNASSTGDVNVSIKTVDIDTLSEEAKEKLADTDIPVFDFTVTKGSKTVSEFKSEVKVSIPYTPKEGQNTNAILVYYINDKGELEQVEGQYNENTRTVNFITDHFSKYLVGYNFVEFEDVKEMSWFFDAVTYIAAREITKGKTKTSFAPTDTITRAEFVALLVRCFELDSVSTTDYIDVSADMWYADYIGKANVILPSFYGRNFEPDKAITREEMMCILYKALEVTDKLDSLEDKGYTLDSFTDYEDISGYALESMTYLVSRDIIHGYDSELSPNNTSTRAEVAQMLYYMIFMINE